MESKDCMSEIYFAALINNVAVTWVTNYLKKQKLTPLLQQFVVCGRVYVEFQLEWVQK